MAILTKSTKRSFSPLVLKCLLFQLVQIIHNTANTHTAFSVCECVCSPAAAAVLPPKGIRLRPWYALPARPDVEYKTWPSQPGNQCQVAVRMCVCVYQSHTQREREERLYLKMCVKRKWCTSKERQWAGENTRKSTFLCELREQLAGGSTEGLVWVWGWDQNSTSHNRWVIHSHTHIHTSVR